MDSDNILILDKINDLKANHEEIIKRVSTGQTRLD